jgi:high-affinity nickel-transport protein
VLAFAAFSGRPVLLGTALLAYTFGLRHAVDADHISAIDNVTRKLMHDGKQPVSVGFFFSLGHSTIVVALSARSRLRRRSSIASLPGLEKLGGVVGASISALLSLCDRGDQHRRVAAGLPDVPARACAAARIPTEHAVDAMLAQRGFWCRLLRTADALDRLELAHVSARRALRPRLRHGDRSGDPRHRGARSRQGRAGLRRS